MAGDLGDRGPAADIGDQGAQGPGLRGGEVIAELIICIGPVPADQTNANRATVVADDMGANFDLPPTGSTLAIEVDQPVIADVTSAAVLHGPAPDFGLLGGEMRCRCERTG